MKRLGKEEAFVSALVPRVSKVFGEGFTDHSFLQVTEIARFGVGFHIDGGDEEGVEIGVFRLESSGEGMEVGAASVSGHFEPCGVGESAENQGWELPCEHGSPLALEEEEDHADARSDQPGEGLMAAQLVSIMCLGDGR